MVRRATSILLFHVDPPVFANLVGKGGLYVAKKERSFACRFRGITSSRVCCFSYICIFCNSAGADISINGCCDEIPLHRCKRRGDTKEDERLHAKA